MNLAHLDLERSGEGWELALEQLEAEAGQSLGIGRTLRDLAGADL